MTKICPRPTGRPAGVILSACVRQVSKPFSDTVRGGGGGEQAFIISS